MVRNRKQTKNGENSVHKKESSSKNSSSNSSSIKNENNNENENGHHSKKFISLSSWYVTVGVASIAIVSYFVYFGYLETRINTPLDEKKIVQKYADPEKYWGTYRPHTYFGLKTRDPHSMVLGLMWYLPNSLKQNGDGMRHWCRLEDKLQKYGWIQHDGKHFGVQKIYDGNHVIETSFIKFYTGKFGGEWTARVNVKAINPEFNEPMSLIWYAAFDEKTDGILKPTYSKLYGIDGNTKGLGSFKINLHNTSGNIIKQSFLSASTQNLEFLSETIQSNLRLAIDKKTNQKFVILAGDTLDEMTKPNFVAIQLNIMAPFTLDITYQSVSNMSSFGNDDDFITLPIGDDYTKLLEKKQIEFHTKFSETFQLEKKGYQKDEIQAAEAALSNMLGSIGYFYGSSRVQSVHTNGPVPYWKAPLYTAVPSRSFFPRGFLWDEGFHALLISTWDIDIELDIMGHWFDLINIEGWIPREQILGIESLARVPEAFVIQHNTNGNPPTFFLALKYMLDKYPDEMLKNNRISVLDKLYPRLHSWFTWFNTTQRGEITGTYRWRGRNDQSILELNPKTLTSGLDDFPRSSHPTDNERHIDLRCWIAYAAGVMIQLGNLLGKNTEKYEETYHYLADNQLMHEQHYSSKSKTFADWGLHTDLASLKRPPPVVSNQRSYQQPEIPEKVRVVQENPEYKFVDKTFGYVNLFPFLLQILDAQHPTLGVLLTKIKDKDLLWTDYGLRSLAKTSPLYMKRNTEHDPPYWRGQIWININYLALKSLHYYMSTPGPYSDQAKEIYTELRKNVVSNIIRQYKLTGYIWEQYNDQTGKGSGCYPFTGWSALFVMIMSEKF